jgi:hypothetical protein
MPGERVFRSLNSNLTLLAGFVLASIELATNLLNPLVQYSSLMLGFSYLALGIV